MLFAWSLFSSTLFKTYHQVCSLLYTIICIYLQNPALTANLLAIVTQRQNYTMKPSKISLPMTVSCYPAVPVRLKLGTGTHSAKQLSGAAASPQVLVMPGLYVFAFKYTKRKRLILAIPSCCKLWFPVLSSLKELSLSAQPNASAAGNRS